MTRRPGGLGRGLDALFPTRPASAPGASGPAEVPVAAIVPNPAQPRSQIAEAELAELAASIRAHGILQPIIVSRAADGYVLIAGERRWRAAQLAGLTTVPALVKDATPRERLELALVENVQRQDLTPLEEAAAYQQLVSEHGLTQEAVAERVGKSRAAVANALRLLHLVPAARAALAAGEITAGHARALLGAPDRTTQEALLARVLAEGLTVRATEELVRRAAPPAAPARAVLPEPPAGPAAAPAPAAPSEAPPVTRRQPPGSAAPSTPDVAAVEAELRQALGTKVQLYRSRRGGRIVIHYFSDDELQGLYERLTGRR
jgi:ParB family chromosome partitioning protein